MIKIKRNDTVLVIAGKDKGKQGKVLKILPSARRAIVEGVNLVKKGKRRTREDQQSGLINIEASIELSNLMLLCVHCKKPVRIGIKALKDGERARFCKSCQEVI